MPFILLTGIPSSGKTRRCKELLEFFQEKGKEVVVVSEADQIVKAGYDKNTVYLDSKKEKHIRGILQSEVQRLISPEVVVILDGLNYIKGYRYELYCATKSFKCRRCTVHTEINREEAWKFNEGRTECEKYTREVYDALVMRYEDPLNTNRWDKPIFLVFPDQELNKEEMYSHLFEKPCPVPNKSTENTPLLSTNYMHDLSKVTKQIIKAIITARKLDTVEKIEIPGYENLYVDASKVSVPELNRLREQYISYSKLNPPNPGQIEQLFIQYLNASLNKPL